MNFGYPFTPYNNFENMTPNFPNQMPVNNQTMPLYPDCGSSCGCNQVVNKCFVEEVPYYVNYHTHGNTN